MNWLPYNPSCFVSFWCTQGLAAFFNIQSNACSVWFFTPRCHWQPPIYYPDSGQGVSCHYVRHNEANKGNVISPFKQVLYLKEQQWYNWDYWLWALQQSVWNCYAVKSTAVHLNSLFPFTFLVWELFSGTTGLQIKDELLTDCPFFLTGCIIPDSSSHSLWCDFSNPPFGSCFWFSRRALVLKCFTYCCFVPKVTYC